MARPPPPTSYLVHPSVRMSQFFANPQKNDHFLISMRSPTFFKFIPQTEATSRVRFYEYIVFTCDRINDFFIYYFFDFFFVYDRAIISKTFVNFSKCIRFIYQCCRVSQKCDLFIRFDGKITSRNFFSQPAEKRKGNILALFVYY